MKRTRRRRPTFARNILISLQGGVRWNKVLPLAELPTTASGVRKNFPITTLAATRRQGAWESTVSLVGETALSVLFLSSDWGREVVRPELELEGGAWGVWGKTFPFTVDDEDNEEDATFSLEDLGQLDVARAPRRWRRGGKLV